MVLGHSHSHWHQSFKEYSNVPTSPDDPFAFTRGPFTEEYLYLASMLFMTTAVASFLLFKTYFGHKYPTSLFIKLVRASANLTGLVLLGITLFKFALPGKLINGQFLDLMITSTALVMCAYLMELVLSPRIYWPSFLHHLASIMYSMLSFGSPSLFQDRFTVGQISSLCHVMAVIAMFGPISAFQDVLMLFYYFFKDSSPLAISNLLYALIFIEFGTRIASHILWLYLYIKNVSGMFTGAKIYVPIIVLVLAAIEYFFAYRRVVIYRAYKVKYFGADGLPLQTKPQGTPAQTNTSQPTTRNQDRDGANHDLQTNQKKGMDRDSSLGNKSLELKTAVSQSPFVILGEFIDVTKTASPPAPALASSSANGADPLVQASILELDLEGPCPDPQDSFRLHSAWSNEPQIKTTSSKNLTVLDLDLDVDCSDHSKAPRSAPGGMPTTSPAFVFNRSDDPDLI